MNVLVVVILVLFSGLFSGLTLGLLSLDVADLKRKIELGHREAKKVYEVRKRGNLLLCTLLLGNVGVNSALAIFLGELASGVIAGVAATGLIVIFGEIVPQAVISRHALRVGARTVWIVKTFMVLLYPVCAPIAWALDKSLGAEMSTIYSKKELMRIVSEHEMSHHSTVDADEERLVHGALSFSDKIVESVMTPWAVVFSLEESLPLDGALRKKIHDEGYSRVPVYEGDINHVSGILYLKDLIHDRPGQCVRDVLRTDKVLIVEKDMKLDQLLNMFIKEKVHLAVVQDVFGATLGVVTLEDVIEEVLVIEIIDEDDQVADLRDVARELARKKRQRKNGDT